MFCGTYEHNRGWGWLTLNMHCSALSSQLLDLQEERYAVQDGKTPRYASGEENGQMRMFPLDIKQREEFSKFAKNLRFYTKENNSKPRVHDETYWKEYRELEYSGYEMFDFFGGFTDEKLNGAADMLEKVGSGEPLEDYKPLIEFLHSLGGHAYGRYANERGGCF